MSEISTSYLGPLGSLIHHFRADARTVTALADLHWSRRFGRVWLDAIRGLVVLMMPSRLHENLGETTNSVVPAAAKVLGSAAARLGSIRWRGENDPPRTGVEPDCCFYVGDRALAYRDALREGEEAADEFADRNPPDLVVEVEITHADRTKPRRYADLGVREFWRLRKQKGHSEIEVEFFALRRSKAPRPLSVSELLPRFTLEIAGESVVELQLILDPDEYTSAVARIIERHEQHGFLSSGDLVAREERAPYVTLPAGDEGYSPSSLSAPRRPEVSTSYLGPLGSTIHHLRLDARTITEIAGLDWDTRFRRVWLDPVRESVVLMEPSRLHDDLTGAFDDLAETAAKALGRDCVMLRSVRWRRAGEPPDTGVEADGAFCFGERAEGYRAALAESEQAAAAFAEQSEPDLVVEVEMTRADEGKVARYAELGVRELWRIHTEKPPFRADFLSLRRDAAPEPLRASEVLPGLTPEDAVAAVEPARLGRSGRERLEAVARSLGRRQPRLHQRAEGAPSGLAPAAAVPQDVVKIEGRR